VHKSLYEQGWYSLIEHSPKALNYRIFKENFEIENYCRILEDKGVVFLSPIKVWDKMTPS
jgi:hypothetical protein